MYFPDWFIVHYSYMITIFLMVSSLYIIVMRSNMIKKLVGLNLFQTTIYLLYLSPSKITGGTVPIIMYDKPGAIYSNPLPQVLILTAIVVGVATLSVGLALVVRINEEFGTIEEDELFDGNV
ncbi:MAG: cation:proton antiporter subunit C [Alphaproteobacteria bacterium]|nr:cation:proton antiporter subunit C [Alphaproteobacteria bacterium]